MQLARKISRIAAIGNLSLFTLLSCGLIGHAAWNRDASETSVEEANAWKVVQKAGETDSTSNNTTKLLSWFLRLYPKGVHEADARFAMGELLFKSGEFSQALPYYQSLLQRRDSSYSEDALFRIGEIHYDMGELGKAQEIWERLSSKISGDSPLEAEIMYSLALCEVHSGQYALASKRLDKLTRKFPGYQNLEKIREIMGILKFEDHDYRGTVEIVEGINTPTATFYRGLGHLHQQQYLEAADAFQKMEGVRSGNFAEIAAFLKADCFRLANNDALAAKAYDQFAAAFPKSEYKAIALIHFAGAQMHLGNYESAMNAVKEVRGMAVPEYIRAYALHQGAEVAIHVKDYKNAISLLSEVAASVGRDDPNLYASVQVAKGYAQLLDGQPQQANKTLQGFVHTMPYTQLSAVAFMLLGEIAYQSKDWDASISAYQSALLQYKYTSLSDVAMTMMLASFFQEGRYQDLVTNSNRVMKVVNSDYSTQNFLWRAYGQLILAEAYYKLKLYTEASLHYEQALKHPSLTPWASFYLAWSRYHEAKYSDAVHLAQKALEDPRFPEQNKASAELLIAASYFNQKDYDSAVTTLQDFRKRFPEDEHVPESWLQEGWAHLQAGFPGDALETWKKLIAQYPNHQLAQEAMLLTGRIYFQARQFPEAATALAKFINRWPNSTSAAEAQWLIAQSFYNNRRDDQAVEAYQEFIKKYPADRRIPDARNQLQLVKYRQASEKADPQLLAEYVAVYPKSDMAPEAQYQLAQILHKKQDMHRAIQEYRKLLLNYPGSSNAPIALLAIARIEDHLNESQAALKEYESVLKLFPTSSVAIDAAMRMGAIYFALNKFADASRSFRFVVDREAAKDVKTSAHYNLAVSVKKSRDYPEALKTFSSFIDQYPDDPKVTDALLEIAALYTAMEQQDKAAETYQAIVKRPNVTPAMKMDIYKQMGEIYQKLGNRDKAIESYGGLIPLEPKKEEGRLLGLAQLAALYEEKGEWSQAIGVYDVIRGSGGRRDWVLAASKRMKQVKAQLQAQAAAQKAAQNDAKDASAPSKKKKSEQTDQ